jgi:hypothetical protein
MVTAIATVMVLTACSSSRDTTASQAAVTQPATTQAATTPPSAQATVTPAVSTHTSARPAPTPKEFVSKRYNFRVTLPKDWVQRDALADWDGKILAGPGSPAFDSFTDPSATRTLMVAAAAVQPRMQLAEWRAAMVRGTPQLCTESLPPRETTIGGESAVAWTVACSDGYDVNKLAVLHGNRGYIFYMPSETQNDDAEDLAIFENARQSFRFTG